MASPVEVAATATHPQEAVQTESHGMLLGGEVIRVGAGTVSQMNNRVHARLRLCAWSGGLLTIPTSEVCWFSLHTVKVIGVNESNHLARL
jgi:hypothetical protein